MVHAQVIVIFPRLARISIRESQNAVKVCLSHFASYVLLRYRAAILDVSRQKSRVI
jgi:hypothetical protein